VRALAGTVLGVALSACNVHVGTPAAAPGAGAEASPSGEPPSASHPKRARVPDDAVERAAAPFVGVRADGELLAPETLLEELSRADLICAGEDHADAQSHYAQLVVLAALHEHAGMSGRELALGLEMVARPEQRALDGYAKLELEEEAFLKESRWSERWGWDFAYYRPMFELARQRGVPMLALNAPRTLTRAVAKGGLASLTREQEKRLPELDLGDAEHRAWFDQTMKGHPHGDPNNVYAAQVVWDESMAEGAARWLGDKLPGRQLAVLAGAGHCRHDAIPKRVKRRVPARVLSVRAVKRGDEKETREALAAFDFVMAFGEG